MVKRKIIMINQDKCTGCRLCIPNCPEGAIQMIDDKARLISDLFCDGLGACIGHCPEGAITIEEREAKPYDERKVMENIVKQGPNTIKAHLDHLRDHGEQGYLDLAIAFLKEKHLHVPHEEPGQQAACSHHACPASAPRTIERPRPGGDISGKRPSELAQWPVQLHLVPPQAPYFRESDVLLSADCVAYATGDFHKDFLTGKSLAIACPKLDSDQEIYIDKIRELIDEARIKSLTVMTMEVPCCQGLLAIATEGAGRAKRKIPITSIIVGIDGAIRRIVKV